MSASASYVTREFSLATIRRFGIGCAAIHPPKKEDEEDLDFCLPPCSLKFHSLPLRTARLTCSRTAYGVRLCN